MSQAPADPGAGGSDPEDSIEIVRATHADAELIVSIVREGFRSEAERYGVEIPPMRETPDEVRTALDAGDIGWLARRGGTAVGTVRGHVQADGTVLVRRLAVLPEARRVGVGRALMAVLEDAYPYVSGFQLFTGSETLPAIALYESLGYVRVREEEEAPGVTIVFLEKTRARRD